jgi:hypothetical protein
MKRLIGMAATLLMVPIIGAAMATTAAASTTTQSIARPGSVWTVDAGKLGCENVKFFGSHKFIGDIGADEGTWVEPTHGTINLKWIAGEDTNTVYTGTFNSAANHYNGHIRFDAGPTMGPAKLIPGLRKGC